MMMDFNAVVLAAGFGKRLRPLTDNVPKALVPLFGVPLVGHVLARLSALRPRPGVVTVNLHHLPQPLVDYLGDGRRWGLRLRFSHETPEILGTGGALRLLEGALGRRPFLVVNGDVYFDAPLSRLLSELESHEGAAGVVGLARDPDRPELNLVALVSEDDPRVVAIADKPARAPNDAPRWVFAGAHLLTRAVFDHLPESGFACVVRDGYVPMLAAGKQIRAVPSPEAAWHDLGTPRSYLDAHFALFPHLARVVGWLPSWGCEEISPGIHVHPQARIAEGAALKPPVVVQAEAVVERGAVLGPMAVIGARTRVLSAVRVQRAVVWADSLVEESVEDVIFSGDKVLSHVRP